MSEGTPDGGATLVARRPRMLCGLLGGREKRGHEAAVLGTALEQALVQPAVPGVWRPGRFSCAIWAGVLSEQCHAPLVTVPCVPGGDKR